jgi:hypothetical protein
MPDCSLLQHLDSEKFTISRFVNTGASQCYIPAGNNGESISHTGEYKERDNKMVLR